jgi:poly(A) polymerase Pap1
MIQQKQENSEVNELMNKVLKELDIIVVRNRYTNDYQKTYCLNNKEKIKKIQQKYYLNNKQKINEKHKIYYHKRKMENKK